MPGGSVHILEVWGEFGCFSRPELKVERWSYPCPTPSGARGVFDAIYFKPQFRWEVSRIELLREPAYIALRRNEVASKVSASNVKSWMAGTVDPSPLIADDGTQRQQRQTMALRNPHYRLHARIVPRPDNEGQQTAYDEQFRRRASQGKCFQQPYLGCREFVAFFRYLDSLDGQPSAIDYNQDLGWMVYDVFNLAKVNDSKAAPNVSVFAANIDKGILDIPPYDSDAVRKPERRVG